MQSYPAEAWSCQHGVSFQLRRRRLTGAFAGKGEADDGRAPCQIGVAGKRPACRGRARRHELHSVLTCQAEWVVTTDAIGGAFVEDREWRLIQYPSMDMDDATYRHLSATKAIV